MDLKLPKLGEGADSGVVVNIFVKEGDQIAKDQPILELENEKAVASVPSTATGIITKIHVKPGDKVGVGQRILSLSDDGKPAAETSATAPDDKRATPKSAPEPEPEAEEEIPKPVAAPVASPSIRRMAGELGIDLSKVRGSEAGGRIVTVDIRAYIQRLQKASEKAKPTTGAAPAAPAAEQVDFSKWGPVTKKPVTQLRQVIARRMSESSNAIPHVTQFDDADFTRLNELRKKYAAAYEKRGAKLTLTPLVLKALAETLKKHPIFNSSLDEVASEIVFKDYVHIGIAVDTDQGLLVPVIRDVDKKSVLDLSKELEQLAQKARDRKVGIDEMKGGSFTISNQGAIGGAHFTPIINRPEAAILGMGRGTMKPVARDGKVEVRMMTPLGLSYNHRVIDGGSAARFIVDLVSAFQELKEDVVKI